MPHVPDTLGDSRSDRKAAPVATPAILIVDDREENLIALEALLEGCGCRIDRAQSGNQALAQLLKRDYALVLLDVQMPEMDGYEVATLMHQNATTRNVPIIFLTAISKDEAFHFKGYEVGAVDYLYKPIEPFILKSKIRVFLQLWHQRQEVERALAQLSEANRQILLQQEQLREMAIHDHLTGLYQRRWFDEMIEKALAASLRTREPLSLAMLDIDHFKEVNDTHGHEGGDRVLIHVARVLEQSVRVADSVFRYGGEEFAILLPQAGLPLAISIAERIRRALAEDCLDSDGKSICCTVSIGVACASEIDPPTTRSLVNTADQRLYSAKHAGRNRVFPSADADAP